VAPVAIGRLDVNGDSAARLAAALADQQLQPGDPEPFLQCAAAVVAREMPTELRAALNDLRGGRRPAVLHVIGIGQCNGLGPTPSDLAHLPAPGDTAVMDGIILGVAQHLGAPVGYRAEKGGALVQHVVPVDGEADAPSNEGSLLPLDLHSELVFSRDHPERPMDALSPHFILLLCLRGDPRAVTVVVPNAALCDRLAVAHLRALREPEFELRAPYSFTRDADGSRPWLGPAPLLHGAADDPRLAVDLACGARALTPAAAAALDALRAAAAAEDVRHEIRLRAGDLLIIDNRRCLHGRSSFAPRHDGTDRWLERVYVREELTSAGRVL
jgi:L-asparagine oxygenase